MPRQGPVSRAPMMKPGPSPRAPSSRKKTDDLGAARLVLEELVGVITLEHPQRIGVDRREILRPRRS